MKCYLCGDESDQSYFLRIGFGMEATVVEACPECHHFERYGTKEQKEAYKRRKNIKCGENTI